MRALGSEYLRSCFNKIWCYDYFNDAVKCILMPPQDLEKVGWIQSRKTDNVWIMSFGQGIKWHVVLNFEYWIFVIAMFSIHCQVLKFEAPSSMCLNTKEAIFRSDFNVDWKKNQNKHSKFNTKFVIWCPVEMTWSEHK